MSGRGWANAVNVSFSVLGPWANERIRGQDFDPTTALQFTVRKELHHSSFIMLNTNAFFMPQ